MTPLLPFTVTIFPNNIVAHRSVQVALVFAGSLLLWASAKLQVPFYPVPMTLQPLALVMLGIILGPTLGTAAVAVYLVEGIFGLPVFAGTPEKGIGIAYMIGPTGGYLLGFLLCTLSAGLLTQKGYGRGFFSRGLIAILAISTIYIPGVAWLAYIIGIEKAITFGLLPFLLGDACKAFLAAALTSAILKFRFRG